jgi:outer membrane protein OmpA-like peptidoglycan-associated protein
MNRRLAIPIILLLLFLGAGAVWALLGPLHLGQKLAPEQQITAEGLRPQDTPAPDPQQEAKRTEPTPALEGKRDFDVVRIDPKGTSVFAGRTEPGAQVTITGDGKKLGTAQADENGEWTFTVEEKFASDDPKLGLDVKPAAEVKKEAALAAVAPPSDKPGSEPGSPATTPPQSGAAPAEAASPHTANAVTAHLLKDLQGMVNEARSDKAKTQDEKQSPSSSAASPPTAPAVTQPPVTDPSTPAAPAASAPGPQIAATKPVPEPPTALEPKPDRGSSTSTKLPPLTPGEATVRKTIPVPITFVFNEAQLTSDGRKAAELLLEYLKLKGFKQVALTGHADERGSDELNMNLSRDRLETVAGFLKQGGFSGDLQLVPKGKTEPYSGVVRSEFSQEELYQLDRRVELVVKP